MRTCALLAAALLPATGCASGPGGRTDPAETATRKELVAREIEAIVDAPPLDGVNFGILAIDVRTERTLYARNADRRFIPASNQKVPVSVAALGLLGTEHRYRTEVWATGSSLGQTLDGDLVLIASGDPSFSDRFRASGEAALYAIADSLYATGLRHVTGSIFVDVSAWDSASVGPTWEVEDLRYGYGATGGAFSIDEGLIRIVASAGPAVGSPANISWRPRGTEDFVVARVETVRPGERTRVSPSYLPESRKLRLEGEIAWGEVDTLAFAIRDPVRQATAALARSIRERGIAVEGTAQVAWVDSMRVGRGCLSGSVRECANASHLVTFESPPMAELVKAVLEASQNWIAEQIIRTLGAEKGDDGSWREGVRVMREFLADEMRIDAAHFSPRDGSGLSAYNLVSPMGMVRLLNRTRAESYGPQLYDALAAPGEEDSTLESRLLDLEGRLAAKTGTISNVNSLSGYLTTASGREVVFSILSNGSGMPANEVRRKIDDVVRVLARY